MADTIEIKVFHVSERLPSVKTAVLVFTEAGTKYIAARYETNAHNPSANQIKWGLIFNNKIIGEVAAVTHWCPLNLRLGPPKTEPQNLPAEIQAVTV